MQSQPRRSFATFTGAAMYQQVRCSGPWPGQPRKRSAAHALSRAIANRDMR